jgi:hypothetical protein
MDAQAAPVLRSTTHAAQLIWCIGCSQQTAVAVPPTQLLPAATAAGLWFTWLHGSWHIRNF